MITLTLEADLRFLIDRGMKHKRTTEYGKKPNVPIGTVFDHWTTISEPFLDARKVWKIQCECDCDYHTQLCVVYYKQTAKLKSDSCINCMQSRKEHGGSYTVEHDAWISMRRRCAPNYSQHFYYFDRGITVCQGFDSDYLHFRRIVGKRPDGDYSLDRIDNDQGYHCEECDECRQKGWKLNVRWATKAQQTANRRPKRINVLTRLKQAYGF